MAARFLTTAIAWLRHAAAHVRPLPLVALLLVAASVIAQVVLLPGRDAAIEQAERELVRAEKALRRAAMAAEAEGRQPDGAPASPLERFQSEAQRNATLGRLLDIASAQGLQIPTGDYRLVAAKGGPLERYVLTLPVRGQYLSIRRYVAAVRADFADLAVDDVTLRRESVATNEVEAQLRFIVFARRGVAS